MRVAATVIAFLVGIESWILPTWAGMFPSHDLNTGRIIAAIFIATGLILLASLDKSR